MKKITLRADTPITSTHLILWSQLRGVTPGQVLDSSEPGQVLVTVGIPTVVSADHKTGVGERDTGKDRHYLLLS